MHKCFQIFKFLRYCFNKYTQKIYAFFSLISIANKTIRRQWSENLLPSILPFFEQALHSAVWAIFPIIAIFQIFPNKHCIADGLSNICNNFEQALHSRCSEQYLLKKWGTAGSILWKIAPRWKENRQFMWEICLGWLSTMLEMLLLNKIFVIFVLCLEMIKHNIFIRALNLKV